MAITLPQIAGVALTLGVLSHLCYFIHGEHHLQAFRYFIVLLLFPPLATVAQIGLHVPVLQAVKQAIVFYSTYLTGLYFSVFLYRAFFHRLHSFPGPFGAKVSKLWHMWKVAPNIDNYKQLGRLHDRYGPFVRTGEHLLNTQIASLSETGPNEVSVLHPDAVEVFYGAASKCTKAAGYESSPGLTSMHSTRSRYHHDRRRRAWARGFTQLGKSISQTRWTS